MLMRCVKSPWRTRSVPMKSSWIELVIERASASPITSATSSMMRKSTRDDDEDEPEGVAERAAPELASTARPRAGDRARRIRKVSATVARVARPSAQSYDVEDAHRRAEEREACSAPSSASVRGDSAGRRRRSSRARGSRSGRPSRRCARRGCRSIAPSSGRSTTTQPMRCVGAPQPADRANDQLGLVRRVRRRHGESCR